MRKTITVRVPDELADWLSTTAEKTGVPQGWIVREQLERARRAEKRPFLRLAGAIRHSNDGRGRRRVERCLGKSHRSS